MVDLARQALAVRLLAEPIPPYRGWVTTVQQYVPSTETEPQWALHFIYLARKDDDVLRSPLSLALVEIDHYHTDAQLTRIIEAMRENIQRTQIELIDEREQYAKR